MKAVPIKAQGAAQTGRLGKPCNAEWRGFHAVPSGL